VQRPSCRAHQQQAGWLPCMLLYTAEAHPTQAHVCPAQMQGYSFDLTPPEYTYYYIVPDGLRCDGVYARCVLQW